MFGGGVTGADVASAAGAASVAAGAGVGTTAAPPVGMRNFCPTKIKFGFVMLLYAATTAVGKL